MKGITKEANVKLKDAGIVGEKTVRAVVTAPTLDRDGDIIDTASLKLPLKKGGYIYARDLTGNEEVDIPFLTNHSFVVEDVIGSVRKAYMNEDGELEVVFGVSSRDKAQDMFTLLDEGHLGNAFSITVLFDYDNMVENRIYDAEIAEISLVFRGSNRDARLVAVTKSLLNKESNMSKDTFADLSVEELEQAQKRIADEIDAKSKEAEVTEEVSEEVESKDAEEKVEDSTEEVEEVKEEAEAEAEVEAEAEEATEEVVEQPKQVEITIKKEETMDAQKSIAQKQAAAPVSDVDAGETRVKTPLNKEAATRKLQGNIAKQLSAKLKKDFGTLNELKREATQISKELGQTSKQITYAGGDDLYLAEQLDRDVETAYGDFGNVGTLVTKVTLTDSPKYSRIVRTDGVEFTEPGFAGVKATDEPTWTRFSLEPKPFSVIVAWSDHFEEDAYVNAYQEIVRDIAEGRAKLEDKIILNYAETVGADSSTTYPDQGLTVTLDGEAGRELDYTADSTFIRTLAQAYGAIQSADRNNLSMVMNGATWGDIALLQDQEGRPLWSGTGQTVSLGALGTVNVRTTDILDEGQIVVGNFNRYRLAQKEGFQLRESKDATVGDLNLFEEDATAVRAVVRLEGGTPQPNAFVILNETS